MLFRIGIPILLSNMNVVLSEMLSSEVRPCDFAILQQYSARSVRQHKGWGVSPRIATESIPRARAAGDSGIVIGIVRVPRSVRPSPLRGLVPFGRRRWRSATALRTLSHRQLTRKITLIFYFNCRIRSCRNFRSGSCWVSARAFSYEDRASAVLPSLRHKSARAECAR